MYHLPVMLKECIEALNIKEDGVYVDVTFGGGGHSREILKGLGKQGRLVAFDQDEDAKRNLPEDEKLVFIDQNFEFIKNHLMYQGLCLVDGLLADLGVSSYQFDTDERGFSYRFDDALLDMRMNANAKRSAADVLNTYTEENLANVLYQYGELTQSRKLAADIVSFRIAKPIQTVADLKKALDRHAPKFREYKFYSQVFQALRIEVNEELEVLKKLLRQCTDIIKPGGVIVIMSYHSLEDRLVKDFINIGNFKGVLEKDFFGNVIKPFSAVQKKAIVASDEETEQNPRARSAKLRIARRCEN
ncbi:MAG: 16S rRNA (cytosine(1402)-N(4))-methyltransferase RsmH [Betaproteobacteria bacterium]|nr:16S rRNA (cytosine(1402)-N(4))-methyltransferase RsmH [Betaproteobacteria bacterium]